MVTMVMAHLLSCHLYFCSGLPSPRAPNRGTWAKSTPHHGLPRNTPYPSPLLSSPSLSSVVSSFLITKLGTAVQEEVDDKEHNDFYVNLGSAVRTLREDLPLMFTKDLNYEIYRKHDLPIRDLDFHGRRLFLLIME